MAISSTNIKLSDIQSATGYSSSTNISLKDQSANAPGASSTLAAAPYGMGEFAGYVPNIHETYFTADQHQYGLSSNAYGHYSGYVDLEHEGTYKSTHTGTGESAYIPADRTFPNNHYAGFMGTLYSGSSNNANLWTIESIAAQSFSSYQYINGQFIQSTFAEDLAYFRVAWTISGNHSSTVSNSGWTDIKIWDPNAGSKGNSASNPMLTLQRSGASYGISYLSTQNYTSVTYTWGAAASSSGVIYNANLASSEIASQAQTFGSSTTVTNNPTWYFSIN